MTPLQRIAEKLRRDHYDPVEILENSERGVVAFISPCELDPGFNGRLMLGRVLFTRCEMDRLRTCWDEGLVEDKIAEAEFALEQGMVS